MSSHYGCRYSLSPPARRRVTEIEPWHRRDLLSSQISLSVCRLSEDQKFTAPSEGQTSSSKTRWQWIVFLPDDLWPSAADSHSAPSKTLRVITSVQHLCLDKYSVLAETSGINVLPAHIYICKWDVWQVHNLFVQLHQTCECLSVVSLFSLLSFLTEQTRLIKCFLYS